MSEKPIEPVAPGVIPVDENGEALSGKRTQKFSFADDDEEPPESITDIGFSKGTANRSDVANLVVPIGASIIDSDAFHKRGTKPKVKDPKSKWSGKGEQLSTDSAIEVSNAHIITESFDQSTLTLSYILKLTATLITLPFPLTRSS